MAAYDDLIAFQRETEALAGVMGLLSWDQETKMPRGGAHRRAEEMGALEGVLHRRRTDPRVAEWLAAIDEGGLDEAARAKLRHIRRDHARACRLPERLATELARVTSRAQGIWAEARADDDAARFVPVLAEVVALKREAGAALGEGTGASAYDALLEGFEPGGNSGQMAAMFARMRPRLVALAQAVLDRPAPAPLSGQFPARGQMALARELARAFGYDFAHGRLDRSVHPFTSGSGSDVRITTRVDEADPLNCIYSTLHEVGHGAYEQNIDRGHELSPLGQGASMAVHESQSRLYENQLGRSRAFTFWLFGRMGEVFGDAGAPDAGAFYAAINRVHPGFIRTEADEVHYNLHVMLRFDLERALIGGALEVADLEGAWNARFAADFGQEVPRPALGFLQDVHWSAGLFGYFPTYTLGNVYAACLMQALRKAVPGLDDDLARGAPGPALGWLRDALQVHGALREPAHTIAHACAAPASEEPLLDYLEAKFGALYGL